MEFKIGLDESSEAPGTPEKIRQFIHKNLRGLISLAVLASSDGTKRPKQINKVILTNKSGEIPEDDVEDICEAIMRIIALRDEQREDGDPPINFKIQGESKDKQGNRHRPSVEYEYSPLGSSDDFTDSFDDPRSNIIQMQTEYISMLQYHLNDAHGSIKEIANNNQQGMKPLMDALGWMGHFYASGLQNQQQAFAMMYDMKKAEAEEKGKTIRMDKWAKLLKKPIGVMSAQFLPWAMAKMTGQPMAEVEFEDDDEDDESDESDETTTTSVSVESMEQEMDLTEEQKNNPVAAYASAIAMCLEADQWFQLSDALKKKEIRIVRALTNAKTDKECVAAYDEFSALPTTKLLALNAILTEDQREMLEQLAELVDASKKKWGEEDGA